MNIQTQIQRQIETTRKSLNTTTLGMEETDKVEVLESMVSQVADLEVDEDDSVSERFETALEALDESVGIGIGEEG